MAVSLEKSPVAHKRAEWNALAREVGHHRFGESVELLQARDRHELDIMAPEWIRQIPLTECGLTPLEVRRAA